MANFYIKASQGVRSMQASVIVPEHIWELAKTAQMKSQIEAPLLAGRLKAVFKRIEEEGVALARELNEHRKKGTAPYAFHALITREVAEATEDAQWFHALQSLYMELIKTFGAVSSD